ncbi:hypothetical protein [Shewanella waksmanii]|uniref:hypothetical protein n=1 Tax=Shewanella waksmanii TaxID=213783 RepID=UPI0037358F68
MRKPNAISASLFVLLTVWCLMQNAGLSPLIKAVNQNVFLATGYTAYDSNIVSASSNDVGSCELSEKSVRVCSENTSVIALFWIVLLLPLLRLSRKNYHQLSRGEARAPPRRVHLTLCRFQE